MTRDDIIRMAREAGWTEYSLLHAVELQRSLQASRSAQFRTLRLHISVMLKWERASLLV